MDSKTPNSSPYFPLWLRDWSNEYFNLRTAVPFVIWVFLLEALFSTAVGLQRINGI
jgi:hypothetical protein